jgi:ubiquinone biosynthesis protein COQ9
LAFFWCDFVPSNGYKTNVIFCTRKKLIFVFAELMAFSLINAQSLEEIIKKYSVAHKINKLSNLNAIKTTSKILVMGMEMQVERWMKNLNQVKTVTNMNGQESFPSEYAVNNGVFCL